jgi:GT2 family glycosyltransferase
MQKITIIIPTYNHLNDCLKPCCESIIANTVFTTDKCSVDTLVVSNGSTDGTIDYVKSLGNNFSFLDFPQPLGYPKSINAGLKHSDSDYFILLNNDTKIIGNSWIDLLLQPFQSADCGVSGPCMSFNTSANSKFLIFFCVMISKPCLQKVGYLDEIFTPGSGEDIDFCVKALQKGFKVVQVPETQLKYETSLQKKTGQFPIIHEAEKTVHEIEKWGKIFQRNNNILYNRYGRT